MRAIQPSVLHRAWRWPITPISNHCQNASLVGSTKPHPRRRKFPVSIVPPVAENEPCVFFCEPLGIAKSSLTPFLVTEAKYLSTLRVHHDFVFLARVLGHHHTRTQRDVELGVSTICTACGTGTRPWRRDARLGRRLLRPSDELFLDQREELGFLVFLGSRPAPWSVTDPHNGCVAGLLLRLRGRTAAHVTTRASTSPSSASRSSCCRVQPA